MKLTSFLFGIEPDGISRNLDKWLPRRSFRTRVATVLRDALHRCYGTSWNDRMTAALSEPQWLRSVWAWCGVYFLGFRGFTFPKVGREVKTFEKDRYGVWWCITTFTPASLGNFLDSMHHEIQRSHGLPPHLMISGKSSGLAADAMRRLAEKAVCRPVLINADYAALERKLAAATADMLLRGGQAVNTVPRPALSMHTKGTAVDLPLDKKAEAPKFVGGVDWGAGEDRTGKVTICMPSPAGEKIVFGPSFELPVRIVPKEAMPEGVAAVVGTFPKPGEEIDPKKFVILKHRTPTPMPTPTIDILILRRSDLLRTRENIPHAEVEIYDFRQTREAINAASDIVFIDGCRQKVFKANVPDVKYMASYFNPSRHDQKVIDGKLVSVFDADASLGIQAGTLICEPWTKEDAAASVPEDDVLGATVTREGQMFHDRGVFIPATKEGGDVL